MPSKSRRSPMTGDEYLALIVQENKTFIRCDKDGTPSQYGHYWKMRDDIYEILEGADALKGEAVNN